MFRKVLALAAVICFAADFTGLGIARAAGAEKGKSLYAQNCMLCHGAAGNGKGPGAVAFNPKPADFNSDKFWQTPNIDQQIAEIVRKGKGQMQAFPDLSQDDIQSIILYLEQAFKPK
jgi:mono/diheme cytochrome c family protein